MELFTSEDRRMIEVKNERLKSCPMCGGVATIFTNIFPAQNEAVISSYEVFCTRCQLTTRRYNEEKYAIEAWNRRLNDTRTSG